jgi:hypothetical protein
LIEAIFTIEHIVFSGLLQIKELIAIQENVEHRKLHEFA